MTCCRIGCRATAEVVASVVDRDGRAFPVYAACPAHVAQLGQLPLSLVLTYGEQAADIIASHEARNLSAGRPS